VPLRVVRGVGRGTRVLDMGGYRRREMGSFGGGGVNLGRPVVSDLLFR